MTPSNLSQDINDILSGGFITARVCRQTWSASKGVKALSSELADAHNADERAFRTMMNLMAGADAEYKAVLAAQVAVDKFVKDNTLPYDSPYRIVSHGDSLTLITKVRPLHDQFVTALDNFCAVYDQRVQEALHNQGTAADPSLYPPVEEIREKFSLEVVFGPVPSKEDFTRLPLPAQAAQALGDRMARRQRDLAQAASDDMVERVTAAVGRMADILTKKENGERTRISASLADDMLRLENLTRQSTFMDDDLRENLLDKLSTLSGYTVEELRKDEVMVRQAASAARVARAALTSAPAPSSAPTPAAATVQTEKTAPEPSQSLSGGDSESAPPDVDEMTSFPPPPGVAQTTLPDGTVISSTLDDDLDFDSLMDD